LIEKNRVEYNPPDRKQTVGCTVHTGRSGERRRHAVHEHRNQQRNNQAGECGDMGAHMEEREQAKQSNHGQRGDQR
jgi:hypothetical protein